MALDAEYFDSIYIDVVKKKYYNANKVQAVFADIRSQAEALNAENERLRGELAGLNGRKVELGDALLSAQAIYQEIVERAQARAEEITADAESRSAAMLQSAREESERMLQQSSHQQEYAVHKVEVAFNRMKELHMASIDALNAEWQSFLCGLYPEGEENQAAPKEERSPAGEPETAAQEAWEQTGSLPPDLQDKVGAIAQQMFSLDGEDHA